MENYFCDLNAIDVTKQIEKKNGFSYLSWVYAWGELKKRFPDATYTVYENRDGWIYHTDGRTCWVKTGVTVNGIEHIETLPVMDFRNNSIPLEQVTSYDVNKAIQRSLTKACARHGLGLYIYAGEDLPEAQAAVKPTTPAQRKKAEGTPPPETSAAPVCTRCGKTITDTVIGGKAYTVASILSVSQRRHHTILCPECMAAMKTDGKA